MSGYGSINRTVFAMAISSLMLTSCAMEGAIEEPEDQDVVVEEPTEDAPTNVVSFVAPIDCTAILPESVIVALRDEGIELVRGPGSPSSEAIYIEGQTPEELIGGLSCLFAPPDDEETGVNIVLSVAAIDESVRPGIINDFLNEGLNVGQTTDGTGLTYWRWGDDVNVTALHNAVYQDSWYSALIQPGGRSAYDRGVSFVDSMRIQTTR
jgi:hypothetical protein